MFTTVACDVTIAERFGDSQLLSDLEQDFNAKDQKDHNHRVRIGTKQVNSSEMFNRPGPVAAHVVISAWHGSLLIYRFYSPTIHTKLPYKIMKIYVG